MLIFVLLIVCGSQTLYYGYYPKICPLLPENLIVCAGQTYSFTLVASHPLNSPSSCTQSTTPATCTFTRLNPTSQSISDQFSVSSSGVITYTAALSDPVIYVGVYSNNPMGTSYTFPYYAMTDIYQFKFTVNSPSFTINCDSNSPSCGYISTNACGTCISLSCGSPHIGKISISGVTDINQFTFALASSTGITISLTNDGTFAISDISCAASAISWSITITNQATTCQTTLTYGSFYLNTAPTLNVSGTFYGYSSISIPVLITDSTNTYNQLSISLNSTDFITSNITASKTFTISTSALTASTWLKVTVSDTGISGYNAMNSVVNLFIEQVSSIAVSVSTEYVYMYAGDWYYDPGYSNTNFYIGISTNASGLYLLNNLTGELVWPESSIDSVSAGNTYSVIYTVYSTLCLCNTVQTTMYLIVIAPPVLSAISPIYSYYSCPYTLALSISYYDLNMLTYQFNGFTTSPILTTSTSAASITFTNPASGSPAYSVTVISPTYKSMNFISYANFTANLFSYSTPTLSITNYTIVATSSLSLNLAYYLNFAVSSLLSFTLNDYAFTITSTGTLTNSSSLISILRNASYVQYPLKIYADYCSHNSSFNFEIIVLQNAFSVDFSSSNFQCLENTTCEFDLSPYIVTNGLSIDSYSFTNTPSPGFTTVNSTFVRYLPPTNVSSSGDITLTLMISQNTISDTFYIEVYKLPLLLNPKISDYSLVIGKPWSYVLSYFSYYNKPLTCAWTNNSNFISNPVFTDSAKTLYWSSVTNALSTSGTSTRFSGSFTCYESSRSSLINTTLSINIPFLYGCSIGGLSTLSAKANLQWTAFVNVIFSDTFEWVNLELPSSPLGMSLNLDSKSGNVYKYELKWIPPSSVGLSQPITLKCTEYFSSITPISTFSSQTISLSSSIPSFLSNCDYTQAIIGLNYTCQLLTSDASSCTLISSSTNSFAGITANFSNNTCTIFWSSSDIQNFGMNPITITVQIQDEFFLTASKSVYLYPNDMPVLISPSNLSSFDVQYGSIYFSLEIVVYDSQPLVYTLVSGPSGLNVNSTGFVLWTSPLTGPGTSDLVVLTVTDTAPVSASIEVVIILTHSSTISFVSPSCPNISQIFVYSNWSYLLTVPLEAVLYVYNFLGTYNSSGLFWTPNNNSEVLGINITFQYSNSSRSCVFNLYPNNPPVIQSGGPFVQSIAQDFYYRINYSDVENNIDQLTLAIDSTNSSFLILADSFGLVYWSNATMSVGTYYFNITVTDCGIPPASVYQLFYISIISYDYPPVFVSPIMNCSDIVKQYLITAVQNVLLNVTVIVYDRDTPISGLNVFLGPFNPYALSITQSPYNSSYFFITWTPGPLALTSGVIGVTVQETAYTSNYDYFELIVYSITTFDFPPVFLSVLPNISVTADDDQTTFDFFYNDYDTKISGVDVFIFSSLGLELKGNDSVYRPKSYVASDIHGTYTIMICSATSCTIGSGTAYVFAANFTPILTTPCCDIFMYNLDGIYEPAWNLTSVNLNSNSPSYCSFEIDGTGSLNVTSNQILWYSVPDDGYFIRFQVFVTNLDCNTLFLGSPTYEDSQFCIQFLCSLIYSDAIDISNDGNFLLLNVSSDNLVYVGSEICEFVGMVNGYYNCSYNTPFGICDPYIFIENSVGISYPYYYNECLKNSIVASLTVTPNAGQGLLGEVVTLKLSPPIIANFTCYLTDNNGNVLSGVLYNNNYTEFYCVLPILPKFSYTIYLYDEHTKISFSTEYFVYQVPVIHAYSSSPLSGHNYGGYYKLIGVSLMGWSVSSGFIRFGDFQIVSATISNSQNITFLVPPRFDFSNSTVTIYFSPTSSPYLWSTYTLSFTYTGDCSVAGTYCSGDSVYDCTLGHNCANTYSSLLSPLPCSAGTYQNLTAKTSCTSCKVGYMCNRDAMINMSICEAGFICDRNSISVPMIMCPPGYFCPEGTNTQITNQTDSKNYTNYYTARIANVTTNVDHWITRGSYDSSTDDFNFTAFIPSCISAYFNGSVSASPKRAPILCPPNTYCLLATKTNITETSSWYTPQTCVNGYTCAQGDGESFDNSQTCVTGSFCPGAGYTGPTCMNDTLPCLTCQCPPGFQCPFQSMTAPSSCTPGSYQPFCGQVYCLSCPASYYCASSNLTNYTAICPAGNMCPEGTSSPKPCSTGSFNPYIGQSNCTVCPIGYYCPSQSMTKPILCNSGYICNALGMSNQIPCSAGYYCPIGTNSSAISNCSLHDKCPIACPAGSQCPLASSAPTVCNSGFYQDQVAQSSCKSCVQGYYCPSSNLTAMVICPAGFYCSSAGLSETSGLCPGGYYCLEGTATDTSTYRQLVIISCSYNSILQYFNGTLPSQPIPCPPGTACSIGTSSNVTGDPSGPQYCLPGYYSSACGTEECSECDSGYYCNVTGTVNPLICPDGTYRSGPLILECQSCPAGTWSAGKSGLGTQEDCENCPAAYICDQEGTYSFSMMNLCSAGYYCPEGTSSLINYCPAGYICPEGMSDTNNTKYPCFQGFVCATGIGITNDMLITCMNDLSKCAVGTKCQRGYFCGAGTSGSGTKCPEGTNSNEGSSSIYDCKASNTVSAIFGTINIVNNVNSTTNLQVSPLSYTIYTFENFNYPNGTVPTAYTIVMNVEGKNQYKIPFVQAGSYAPIYRLPLSSYYGPILSEKNQRIQIAVLAHQTVTITFTVEFLTGMYTFSQLSSEFLNSVSFQSTQYSTRYNKNSFLTVLNRNSQDSFKPPCNLPIHNIYTSDVSLYIDDIQSFVDSVSVSVIDGIDPPSSEMYTQSSYDFWGSLQYSQQLYPLDYLPFITDCEGYGAHIPLYLLFQSSKCNLIDAANTVYVDILAPLTVPVGDTCNLYFSCRTSEKVSTTDTLALWFESYELSTSNIFYFTRNQFSMYEYSDAIPVMGGDQNSFSANFYGSSSIIGVSSIRSSSGYSPGMIPKSVKLYVGYYQKNKVDKEILTSTIYFEEFSSDLNNRTYSFNFVLEPLPWKQCLDLFAFDEYLYYIFVLIVCLVILGVVIVFWAVNYTCSTMLPRPSLKIKLYLNYSLRTIKGISMVVFPSFGLIFSMVYLLQNLNVLKSVPGSFYDNEPINPTSTNDITRITKYLNGRLGSCISFIGFYMIYKSSNLLFADAVIAENVKDIPRLNKQVKRLKGLFIWSIIPVLIFSLSIYAFSKSEVYFSLQTLFIFIFKLLNTRIVEMCRELFEDDLYVLPFYGAMSLTVMLVTIKVGAFTAFLSGYLTNIMIKIAKRTFLEPYRIEIKNQILKLKQKFKLGGSTDPSSSLGFKDRVYVEQISDLGANSLESIAAWLFPILIVFNYVLYSELQLAIAKDFLKYFIVFCFLQAFSDIAYDIFLNNAIECRTGRLLSEKIIDLKHVFGNRKCLWALSDKTPHSGKDLVESLDNLLRLGFSTQYFFLMTLSTVGIVLQIYAVELWVNWNYNPFDDPAAIFLMMGILFLCWIIERILIYFGKVIKLWQLKEEQKEENISFNKLIKMHLSRALEENSGLHREDLFYNALSQIILDCYDQEINEKKRKAHIIRILKELEEEIEKIDENNQKKEVDIDALPLPKVRQKVSNRIMKTRKRINAVPLKTFGTWPSELNYQWKSNL